MEDIILPATMAEAAVPSLPKTAFYIPNFITEIEERNILDRASFLVVLHTLDTLFNVCFPDLFRAPSHLEASLPPPPTNLSLTLDSTTHTARLSVTGLAIRACHTSSSVLITRY